MSQFYRIGQGIVTVKFHQVQRVVVKFDDRFQRQPLLHLGQFQITGAILREYCAI
jgi:hypothetical protein